MFAVYTLMNFEEKMIFIHSIRPFL